MAASKSKEEKEKLFDEIIDRIATEKESMRKAIKGRLAPATFYKMLDEDKDKMNQYVRACDYRTDAIFEEMFEIADDGRNDYMTKKTANGEIEVVNTEHIQRSKLRIDHRKWAVSKMNPKKYGDKLDVTSGNEKINTAAPVKIEMDGKEILLK